jgi:putative PIN family toxin of toxin-antitoxin system
MTNRPRYVLDTNVIVSALLFPDSKPGQALFAAQRRGEILLSDEAVAEIIEVLHRPKFDRYVLPDERDWFLATLIRQAKLVFPTERICVCRDEGR